MNIDRTKSSGRALADPAAGVILASVDISAPAERVFRALSDPRELVQWWGSPETYRAHKWEADFRVGGRWRVEGKGANGQPYSVCGEFLEIAAPRKLVQTWSYDWDKRQAPTKLTYTLEDVPRGTRVVVRHEGFATSEACAAHAVGWDRVLGWLEGHIKKPTVAGL